MEAALGISLLRRLRRGVELTPAGESLLAHARIVLADVEALQGDLAAYARGAKATIHMLANTAGLSEHLPRVLASFLVAHPDINIAVDERDSPRIGQAIASGAADLGLAVGQALSGSLAQFPFCDDHLVLVAPLGDAIARRRQVAFADVLERDFAGLPEGSVLQDHIAGHAARLGRKLRLRARLKTFDAICQMVEAGVGVAVMPEIAARRAARTLKIARVRLRDSWARRRLVVCARSFSALPRPAQLLVSHLRASAATLTD
ncbi:MAG: LysR substrate-binding domain-containing protein [Xanthobacteraceae bacterium]